MVNYHNKKICILGKLRYFFLFGCLVLSSFQIVHAQETKLGEYQVKAAFLYNLVKFVDWPEESLKNTVSIALCILGDDPFGEHIDAIHGKPLKGKTLFVKRINSVKEAKDCHILFISSSEGKNLTHILRELNDSHILTIGDTDYFAQQGVIFNFFIEYNKVRFEINVDAAKLARIQVSSKLLKLAKIIEPKANR